MVQNHNLRLVRFAAVVLGFIGPAANAEDPLASWNDGPAKQAILEFVKETTTQGGQQFVPPEARIAAFDQDGTLWVEHPMYTQVIYCLERVPDLVKARPELKDKPPFNTVLELLHGDRAAMEQLDMKDLEIIAMATLTGMSVDQFRQGSILAFAFLSITVTKQPPDTPMLPLTLSVFVICPALYEIPALFCRCSS